MVDLHTQCMRIDTSQDLTPCYPNQVASPANQNRTRPRTTTWSTLQILNDQVIPPIRTQNLNSMWLGLNSDSSNKLNHFQTGTIATKPWSRYTTVSILFLLLVYMRVRFCFLNFGWKKYARGVRVFARTEQGEGDVVLWVFFSKGSNGGMGMMTTIV